MTQTTNQTGIGLCQFSRLSAFVCVSLFPLSVSCRGLSVAWKIRGLSFLVELAACIDDVGNGGIVIAAARVCGSQLWERRRQYFGEENEDGGGLVLLWKVKEKKKEMVLHVYKLNMARSRAERNGGDKCNGYKQTRRTAAAAWKCGGFGLVVWCREVERMDMSGREGFGERERAEL
ncbi:hypothetical protein ACFE04_001211 [Oxalis oulophora]